MDNLALPALLSATSLVMVALLVIFLGVYTIRFPWEKSGIGRALVAGSTGLLISSIGDLALNVDDDALGAVLTIVGSLWISTVFVWGVVLVIRGGFAAVIPPLPPAPPAEQDCPMRPDHHA